MENFPRGESAENVTPTYARTEFEPTEKVEISEDLRGPGEQIGPFTSTRIPGGERDFIPTCCFRRKKYGALFDGICRPLPFSPRLLFFSIWGIWGNAKKGTSREDQ